MSIYRKFTVWKKNGMYADITWLFQKEDRFSIHLSTAREQQWNRKQLNQNILAKLTQIIAIIYELSIEKPLVLLFKNPMMIMDGEL